VAELTIAPLKAADKTEWQPLWQGYLEFYRSERPPEMYDLLWQRLLNDNPHDGSGLIARLDGKAVGIAHTYVQRHGWYEEEVVYLQVQWLTAESNSVARKLYDEIGELTPFIQYRRPSPGSA